MLKEREAQIELKKVMSQLTREQEAELQEQNLKLSLEKERLDEDSYRKKLDETRKLYEFNKKQ